MNGWIKLHRKITEKGFYKKSQYLHLWVHLLLSANHKDNEFVWNGKTIIIKEGQFIAGRHQLSFDTGIPESTIHDILKFFQNENLIQQQTYSKFRIISIANWKKYQSEEMLQQQSNSRATAEQQQSNTNNNDKNDKNDKNIYKDFKIFENSDFSEAWVEWETHRKEMRHTLTNTTRKKQLTFLSQFPVQTAVEMINQSISMGWQGLFELTNGTKPKNRGTKRYNLPGTADKEYKTADI